MAHVGEEVLLAVIHTHRCERLVHDAELVILDVDAKGAVEDLYRFLIKDLADLEETTELVLVVVIVAEFTDPANDVGLEHTGNRFGGGKLGSESIRSTLASTAYPARDAADMSPVVEGSITESHLSYLR